MLKNYLKIAFRNLKEHKGTAVINIAGLAVGIAVCFIIIFWIQDELSYDHFHKKSDRIYRSLWDAKVGDNEWVIPHIPVPVGQTLKQEFPEVERTTNLADGEFVVRMQDEFVQETDVIYAEPSIFEIFTFRFIAGNPQTALRDPNSVILTGETARRYFGTTDVLGETLELNNGKFLQVTAVVESWPKQSHIQFDFIEPLSIQEGVSSQWGSAVVRTYFTLRKGERIADLQEKFDRYVEEHVVAGSSLYSAPGNYTRFPSQALTDIHLRSRAQFGMDEGGDIRYIILFSIIGLFILLLACINFINLTTARSARRMREIGLRKVMGSHRSQLVRQFLTESFVYVLIAVGLAVILTELALPFFNELAGKQMQIDYFSNPTAIAVLLGLAVLVGILAGSYPAFHLSSFMPVRALKGRLQGKSSRNRFRDGLVIIQFCVSVALIIGTLVVHSQLKYMQQAKLGFDKEQVVVLRGARALEGRHESFIQELESAPGVLSATATHTLPGYGFGSTMFAPGQPANYERTSLSYTLADYNFVDVLDLNIVEGRNFSREFSTDSLAYLINESAAEALGWDNPVGKQIAMGGASPGPVIGVVEDFHYQSLHSEIQPLVLPFIRWTPRLIAVRVAPGQSGEYLATIRNAWNKFVPQKPFDYAFLDQDVQTWYVNEERVASLLNVFTVLAIFIACFGLFGLVSFTARQRVKEIGVRKVLGATVTNIVGLLSKDFLKLVVIGFVIAVPIAWYAMNQWLADFAYKIEIGPGIFLLAGGLALLIALATVSWQSVKAALANPVDSLRSE